MRVRPRLAVLLGLLALSLVALWKRERVQTWLSHEHMDTENLVGSRAPELPALRSLSGRAVTLESLRGRVVLLAFWTFGCSNCEHMTPHYAEWNRRFGPRGLTIVGVHAPETTAERDVSRLARYVGDHGIVWLIVLDPDFEAWNRYRVQAWPTVVVIDRAGTVRSVYVGDNRAGSIEADVQRLVGG